MIAAVSIVMSSCRTNQMTRSEYYGGTMGAYIGGVIGEALGVTLGRDSYTGAVIGNAVGTLAGAVIGSSMAGKDRRDITRNIGRDRDTDDYNVYSNPYGNYGEAMPDRPLPPPPAPQFGSAPVGTELIISNVTYEDENGDGYISKDETICVSYDVWNASKQEVEVTLVIIDPVNQKHIAFSPATTLSMMPGQRMRYKAKAYCKSHPKNNVTHIIVAAQSKALGNVNSTLQIDYK